MSQSPDDDRQLLHDVNAGQEPDLPDGPGLVALSCSEMPLCVHPMLKDPYKCFLFVLICIQLWSCSDVKTKCRVSKSWCFNFDPPCSVVVEDYKKYYILVIKLLQQAACRNLIYFLNQLSLIYINICSIISIFPYICIGLCKCLCSNQA